MRCECPGIVENILCAEHFRRHIVCADKSAHIGGSTESVIRCLSLCLSVVLAVSLADADASADAGHRYVNHQRTAKFAFIANAFEYFRHAPTRTNTCSHASTRAFVQFVFDCAICQYILSMDRVIGPSLYATRESTTRKYSIIIQQCALSRAHSTLAARLCPFNLCAPHKSRDHHTR